MRPVTAHSQKLDKLRDNCPVKATIDVIRGRWKPYILRELKDGTKRFAELRAALPEVTAQILTLQLRQLEADEIVTRTVYPEVPARVEYQLSKFGRTLSRAMVELAEWGESYLAREQRRASSRR